MANSKINGVSAIIKFIYVNLIVIIHCGMPWGEGYLISGSYIFCDFLFIAMGYYGSFVDNNGQMRAVESAWRYVVKRLKNWFPAVFVETVILFLVHSIRQFDKVDTVQAYIDRGIGAAYDISFLRVFVPDAPGMNGTLWFLQAALWGGAMIMMLGTFEKLNTNIWFWGSFSFVVYSLFFFRVGHMEHWWDTKVWLFVQDSLPRAMAGISLGIAANLLVKKIKKNIQLKWLLRIVVWSTFLLTVYLTTVKARSKWDFVQILLFCIIIILNGLDENYLEGKVATYFNKITFNVYLYQLIVINIVIGISGKIQSMHQLFVVLICNFLIANIALYIRQRILNKEER